MQTLTKPTKRETQPIEFIKPVTKAEKAARYVPPLSKEETEAKKAREALNAEYRRLVKLEEAKPLAVRRTKEQLVTLAKKNLGYTN